ncbi:TPA: hypothetical protein ACOENC_002617, partial [Stenotrophomonas maltophilia]
STPVADCTVRADHRASLCWQCLTAWENAESVSNRVIFATLLIGIAQRHGLRWRATGKGWPGFESRVGFE